jgi:hypothetical protein
VLISNSSTFDGLFLRSIETTAKTLTVDFLTKGLIYVQVLPVTKVGLGRFAQTSATIIIPELGSTSVLLTSNVTGAIARATVRMTAAMDFLQNYRISIRFPVGFSVSGVQLGSVVNPPGISASLSIDTNPNSPCGTDCTPSLETLSIQYTAATSLTNGTNFMLTLYNIKNRRWSGMAGSSCSVFLDKDLCSSTDSTC